MTKVGLNLWDKIWRAQIPPKVRVFMWRLLRGTLPTRVALAKKFHVLDISCVYCNKQAESDIHLFLYCKAMRVFWNTSPIGVRLSENRDLSIYDWLMRMLDSPHGKSSDLLFMSFWVIWSERNKIVWNGGHFSPLFLTTWASTLLEEYQKFHPYKMKNKKRPLSKWEFPPKERLKINIDGAFHHDSHVGGVGVIVRDENGRCVAAFHRSIVHASSAYHVEAEACRAGILIAISQGWDNIMLETDCSVLAAALACSDADYSNIGCIIGDCKDYMLAFTSINIRHIFREANCVAHRLAHIASLSTVDDFWIDFTPSLIEDVIYEDISYCT